MSAISIQRLQESLVKLEEVAELLGDVVPIRIFHDHSLMDAVEKVQRIVKTELAYQEKQLLEEYERPYMNGDVPRLEV